MDTNVLSGTLFANMVRGASINLKENKTVVNDLNVFPIPDGDTGDNMYMTVEAGAGAAVAHIEESLGDVAAQTARGMLLGARGNSGVILSRIFAGVAEGFKGMKVTGVRGLGEALQAGVRQAYDAVSVPVEGTILTVYRDAVEFANAEITDEMTLIEYFENFTLELRRSLDRTPEILAVLRDAGVVDSGGAGFVYIADGMKRVLLGEELTDTASETAGEKKKTVDLSAFDADSQMTYGYCTEFLLQLQNSKIDVSAFDLDEMKDYLSDIGDSLVLFLEGTIVKCHVHTMNPGHVLNYCQQFGEFLTLKIENMTLQHSETSIENRYESKTDDKYVPKKIERRQKVATVAVSCGEGVRQTFTDLGAGYVVEGGQSMNPSAEDFIRAFDAVNADDIFVLPNNKNILLTAQQAAELYESSRVHVIPSTTIGDGYAALSMFDYESHDPVAIYENAVDSMEGVVTGEVSRAVRNANSGGVEVHAGDYLGFVGSHIYVAEESRNEAAEKLADALEAGERDVIILICGADAPAEEADELYQTLSKKYRGTEIIMQNGGQAVYDYIMILE